jgi:bacillithiol biosynthesis cysteine-adding enzyme BshC
MPLKKHTVSLAETGQFSSLFIDYVNGKDALRTFYQYTPELASFKQAITDRKKIPLNRSLLSEVILDQYHSRVKAEMKDFQAVNANIELLPDENTFTVCTAHQPSLFTGPLYFIYKIISAINLAEQLKKEYPAYNFVPVYWIGSEDHDLEEIGTLNMFGKKLSWDTEQKGAVGRMDPASMEPLLEEIRQILGTSEPAEELYGIFHTAYHAHATIADATRYLVHTLFGSYGLVVIDADDVRLRTEFMRIIKDDISSNTNFSLVNESIAAMKAAGYDAQVNPREINVFRLTANDRVRIEEADPETLDYPVDEYSTNVVLRPLYQQMILPNIAYVGGPGEIAYWLEYKRMFDHHNIFFPVLMPRNFALLTDEKASRQLDKLGFEPKDLFRDTDALIKELVSRNAENDISLKAQEEEMRAVFTELSAKAAAIDPTLKASVESELQKALGSLKNIESKLMKAEKQKQETNIGQLRKLKEKFLSGGILQERNDNFAPYYLKTGKDFIPALKEAFDPFEFKLIILEL